MKANAVERLCWFFSCNEIESVFHYSLCIWWNCLWCAGLRKRWYVERVVLKNCITEKKPRTTNCDVLLTGNVKSVSLLMILDIPLKLCWCCKNMVVDWLAGYRFIMFEQLGLITVSTLIFPWPSPTHKAQENLPTIVIHDHFHNVFITMIESEDIQFETHVF